MLRIEALYIDDDVLGKVEGKHGLRILDIEEALVYSRERCFHKVGGGQIRVLLQTSVGEYVVAFLTNLEGGEWRLNSARKMTPNERRFFKSAKKG